MNDQEKAGYWGSGSLGAGDGVETAIKVLNT